MTGRGMGFCAGYSVPGFESAPANTAGMYRPAGRGLGPAWGRPGAGGRGRGFRNKYFRTGLPGWQRAAGAGIPGYSGAAVQPEPRTAEEEKEMLRNEAEYLERELQAIKERMNKLGKEEGETNG